MTKEMETQSRTKDKKGEEIENISSMEDIRELYENSFQNFKEGNIIKGHILAIRKDDVIVDIGYKSEGIIPASEFRDMHNWKIGDELEVFLEDLEDSNGMVVLSKQKADKVRNWEKTVALCQEGNIVEGKIYKKVKGGLMVDIGMDAFLPASQIDIKMITNLDEYVGKTYKFKIVQINTERKNVVVSRRELLEEARMKSRTKMLSEIAAGDIRKGVVKNITDFGAFIDISGVDGLLHLSDMSWGKISHPSEMLAIGDTVEVMVLSFDKEKERVSLGLKQKTPNPWDNIEDKYPVGSKVKGKIVNLMPYGAFMELEEGVEGLIHISEISWTKKINHPSDVLAIGDFVETMVLSLEKDEQKISLGVKQTEFNPWTLVEDKYKEGMKVKGKISNITNYGAFMELEDGIDGLIHLSDISWTKRLNHPSEVLKKGEIVEAVVMSVSKEQKKVSLGLKQLTPNPWENINERVKVGDVITGQINKITGFGIFLDIGDEIEGLVHKSQIPLDESQKDQEIKDIYKKGDEITAKVVKVDIEEKKIALSMKEYVSSQCIEEYKKKQNSENLNSPVLDETTAEELKKEKLD